MKTTILDYTIEYDVRKEETVSYSKVVGTDIAGSEITVSAKEGEKGAKKSTKTNLFVDVKIGEDMEGNAIVVSSVIAAEKQAEDVAIHIAIQNVSGIALAVRETQEKEYKAKLEDDAEKAKEKIAETAKAKELENELIYAYQAISRETQEGYEEDKAKDYKKVSDFSKEVIAASLKKYFGGKAVKQLKKEAKENVL